jgi:hypothetical protein
LKKLFNILKLLLPIIVPFIIGWMIGIDPHKYIREPEVIITGFVLAYCGSQVRSLLSIKSINKLKTNQFILGKLTAQIVDTSHIIKIYAEQIPGLLDFDKRVQIRNVNNAKKALELSADNLEKTAEFIEKITKE